MCITIKNTGPSPVILPIEESASTTVWTIYKAVEIHYPYNGESDDYSSSSDSKVEEELISASHSVGDISVYQSKQIKQVSVFP